MLFSMSFQNHYRKECLEGAKTISYPPGDHESPMNNPASLEGVSCFLLNLQGGAEAATTGEPQHTQGDQLGSLK